MNRIVMFAYESGCRLTVALFLEGGRLVDTAKATDITTEDVVEWVERARMPTAEKLGWSWTETKE